MNRPETTINRLRQRGALSVITPLLLLFVIILTVMALDGARLYSLRSEMQAQVNVAAQAAAAEAQTCGGLTPSTSLVQQRALTAARAQGFTGEDDGLDVRIGLIEQLSEENKILSFSPVNRIEESNAVLVSYTRSEPISLLLPESTFGSLDISVNAAARKQVVATLSAAGSTVSVDAGIVGGLLGAVLDNDTYTLDPTSLDSLRNTTVGLGDLMEQIGVADVSELLALDGRELAGGLRDLAGVASPAGRVLDDLLSANGISTLQVSDVLEVVENTQVPADNEFPLYDMLISLVLNVAETQQDADGGFIDVPLDLNLNTGLANVTASVDLHVGESPKVVFGPARQGVDGNWVTRFYAPDVSLLVNAEIELVSLGLVDVARVTLPLAVNAGGAEGAFVAARCASGSSNDVEVVVDIERSVARLGSGSIDPDSGVVIPQSVSLTVMDGLLFPSPVLRADVSVEGDVQGVPARQVVLSDNYPLYCDSQDGCFREVYEDTGDGIGGLSLKTDLSNVELLGLPVGVLLGPLESLLENTLSDVVEGLAGTLVNPLLESLGIGLGGVTVTLSSATQGSSQLIENVTIAEED